MEGFSLLWPPDLDPERVSGAIDEQASADLGLERIAETMAGEDANPRQILATLRQPVLCPATIAYRQEILADLEELEGVAAELAALAPRIRELAYCGETRRGEPSALRQMLWRLGELELYVACIRALSRLFATVQVRSAGLRALARAVEQRRADPLFANLERELPRLAAAIHRRTSVTIGVNLDERLRPVQAALLAVHDRPVAPRSLLARLAGTDGEESLKAIGPLHSNAGPEALPSPNLPLAPLFQDLDALLQSVARPVVRALERYVRLNTGFLAALAPEIAFYLGVLRLCRTVRATGLPFTLPTLAPMEARVFEARSFYNLSMALRFRASEPTARLRERVVCNDVHLAPDAGIFVLTGPNRGGKTTFTQGIGLAQLLAQAGLPVPAAEARISPVDRLATHFPRAERGDLETGRLGEEASRIAAIFGSITRHSLVLLNESLSNTSPGESLYLAEDILRAFRLVGCRVVFATHLHELAARVDEINRGGEGSVTAVSVVAEALPAEAGSGNGEVRRTYRIAPGPPAGRSYAKDIAERHGISFEKLLATLRARQIL